jgi:hypothetical protein
MPSCFHIKGIIRDEFINYPKARYEIACLVFAYRGRKRFLRIAEHIWKTVADTFLPALSAVKAERAVLLALVARYVFGMISRDYSRGGFSRMKNALALASACALVVLFSGCATTGAISGGAVTTRGLKPATQVMPCCRDLVEGRISLAECMEKPECIANNRQCCMNAIR